MLVMKFFPINLISPVKFRFLQSDEIFPDEDLHFQVDWSNIEYLIGTFTSALI